MSDLLTSQETPVIAKTKELCASLLELDSYKRMKNQLDAFVTDDTVVRYVTKTFELGRVPTEEEVTPKQGGCCGGGCGGGSCGSGGCS
jgi:uncharacterized membrane protein